MKLGVLELDPGRVDLLFLAEALDALVKAELAHQLV
jgi:hypothetical protein